MTLWFYNFAKKNEQKKKIRCLSEKKKKTRKTKQCYHNDISRWKRDNFSSAVEFTRGLFEKDIKREKFKIDLIN